MSEEQEIERIAAAIYSETDHETARLTSTELARVAHAEMKKIEAERDALGRKLFDGMRARGITVNGEPI